MERKGGKEGKKKTKPEGIIRGGTGWNEGGTGWRRKGWKERGGNKERRKLMWKENYDDIYWENDGKRRSKKGKKHKESAGAQQAYPRAAPVPNFT